MASWNSRGLRGSMLEESLNMTNEKYRREKLALVQKIPTPITPMEFDKEHHHITLAYFEQKSTVDYLGNVQGIPICFDAKECAVDTFPLQNIHEHQVNFMTEFEQQDGISFLIIYFSHCNEYYYDYNNVFCAICSFMVYAFAKRKTDKEGKSNFKY